jgi:hypothetical protein
LPDNSVSLLSHRERVRVRGISRLNRVPGKNAGAVAGVEEDEYGGSGA